MSSSLKNIYKKNQFQPGVVGVLTNPLYLIRRELYKGIKAFAPSLHGALLDFGCGSKPYKNLFNNVTSYIGVDIHNEAHPHEENTVDVFYDGRTLPFPDNSFDSILCTEVLEHVFNIDQILNELRRVLKPGGKILITVPFAWDEHEIPYDFARYTSYGIHALLERNGFKVECYDKLGHFMKVVFQYSILYIYYTLKTNSKYINILFNILFISPFTLLSILLSSIVPKKKTLYFSNIILATKE